MELHQLKYFAQAAKTESISKAAEQLKLSQPAVSKNIIKLEEELGTQLFDRVGKRIYLNDHGRLFLHGVEKALQDLGEATSLMANVANGSKGSLSVVAYGSPMDAIDCITSFMKVNPQYHVTLNTRQRSGAVQAVRDFDLVFYPAGSMFSGVSGIAYNHTKLWACVSPDHPLAEETSIEISRLQGEPFIMTNATSSMYERSYKLCIENGFSPWVRATTSSMAALMEFVRAGLGVCLFEAPAGRAGLPPEVNGVKCLELKGSAPEQMLYFATKPVSFLTPPARKLLMYTFDFFGIKATDAILETFEAN